MIYDYSISPEAKYVHVIAKGNYSIRDIKKLIEIIISNERYKPDFNSLIDIRKVKYTPVVSEILEISEFIITMKNSFKSKVALVVNGQFLYTLFKLSANRSKKNGIKFDIFTDLEKANNWISES